MNEINKTVGTEIDDAVRLMEERYPEMTSEFKKITQEQYILFCQKQMLYGPTNISQGTDLSREEDKDFSLKGLYFRVNDKIQRIKTMLFFNVKDTVGEDLEETCGDMSNYGIIARIILRNKWGK